ncbi:MAG: hydroxymethylbilane synthase [Ornithinimicrobium sp.]
MILGTRASALAMTQANWVAARLREQGESVDLVTVRTHGDVSKAPLTEIGGTGVFASALRSALRSGEIDVAVHSLKDLPVAQEPGLRVAAIPAREDARDVVVTADGRELDALAEGCTVGTGSPRRAGQLATIAQHLRIVGIRGNVDTRVSKVRSGEVDAVVLAAAGLRRLGRHADVSQTLELTQMLPAPGQGALAIECRDPRGSTGPRDAEVHEACARLDDRVTRDCVTAERAMLARLEAGCTAPVGAYAEPEGSGGYRLTGWVEMDGKTARDAASGNEPHHLGETLAERLLHHLSVETKKSILVMERES